ncbi:MAG: hypothetical protein D6701_09485 [Gemmatimonadetes bacterium]|nr:MAG: hypothetical protein D6701_09485 [Gemmatimonadota bacterium]
MSDAPQPVLGVVITHGGAARGLVDAVARISGVDTDALIAISNDGLAPEALRERVDRAVGGRRAVLFTDLASGSCAVAGHLCCRGQGTRALVSGVNLPMLLDFVFHRDLELEPLVERLVEKGRESVRAVLPGDG